MTIVERGSRISVELPPPTHAVTRLFTEKGRQERLAELRAQIEYLAGKGKVKAAAALGREAKGIEQTGRG